MGWGLTPRTISNKKATQPKGTTNKSTPILVGPTTTTGARAVVVRDDGAARGRHMKLLKPLPTLLLRTIEPRLKMVQAVPKVMVVANNDNSRRGTPPYGYNSSKTNWNLRTRRGFPTSRVLETEGPRGGCVGNLAVERHVEWAPCYLGWELVPHWNWNFLIFLQPVGFTMSMAP